MATNYLTTMLRDFFVAFGIVLGASMMAGVYAILTMQPPTVTMQRIAESLKFWALIAAVGGTIEPFRNIETHFLGGQLSPAIKEILYIFSAFLGAHLATKLVQWICQSGAGNG